MTDFIVTNFSANPLLALFLSGFLSATLLPGSSEVALYASLQLELSPIWVISVATLGNTLGGLTNYLVGIYLPNRTLKEKRGHKLESLIHQYGYLTLLLSWLPVIGDPLCVAAGWMRLKFWPCAICILLGKALRYAFLSFVFLSLG